MQVLATDGHEDAIGIVDLDFQAISGAEELPPNIVHTNSRDLESFLVDSEALDKVLNAYASNRKLEAVGPFDAVREVIREAAAPAGGLRYVSHRDGHRLDFNGINFRAFVRRRDLAVDIGSLVNHVCDKSNRHDVDRRELAGEVQKVVEAIGPQDLCCGHDLVQVLSIALTSLIGSRSQTEVSIATLESALQLAYESEWFAETTMTQQLTAWEQEHPNRQVLKK